MEPGLLSEYKGFQLGNATLANIIVFFVLALSAFFLLILLSGLLIALLALTGLAALLAILTRLTRLSTLLSRLTTLTTLLSIFFHIVCHERVLRVSARLGARFTPLLLFSCANSCERLGREIDAIP
jgi:hypothetical protein